MEYSFKDLFESAYQGKTTTYPKEKTKRRNKPESIEEKNEKIHEEKNTRKVQEKALVQLDRSLKKKFEKEFDFKIDFHDIKDGFIIIGSNPKTSQTGEQLSTTSSVYRYNIFNDSLINLKKLESSKSISFLAALEIHNSVLICYNNDDCVIFDYLKEVEILKFNEKKLIKNVITEQGLKKIFFTTEFDLWEWNPLESLPKIKYLKFLEGPIKHIDKIKEVNIFLFLTEAGQMKAYIHTTRQILEIEKLKNIIVSRFMFMKESQILILETLDNKFQIWKVQVDYPQFKQRFTQNIDSEGSDQLFKGDEGDIKESKQKEPQKDLYVSDIIEFKDESLIQLSSSDKILKLSDNVIKTKLNNLPENNKKFTSAPLELIKIRNFEPKFIPNLWDFCDSSNILFLTQKRENRYYLYCYFTHNNDGKEISLFSDDKIITEMKICQSTQWMILKNNSKVVEGLNLSKTGFHPFGRHEHIIDVFFDQTTDKMYTCGSNSIKKWNMRTEKCVRSKTLFNDGRTTAISYKFDTNTKKIFFLTSNNYIGFINVPTLGNRQIFKPTNNNNPIFEDDIIFIQINNKTLSLIFAHKSLPNLHRWDINNRNNQKFNFNFIKTNNKVIGQLHISENHSLIIVFFEKSPEIHFYDATQYHIRKKLTMFKPLLLTFIFENQENNHLYIGVEKLIFIIDLVSLEEIKEVPIKNTKGYQISNEYLLINYKNSSSVKIWSLRTLSLVCKLDNFYFSEKQISIFKLLANRLFIANKTHYLFQKFISNNTQNISCKILLENNTREPKDWLSLFENHIRKYIFSKKELQINHFNVQKNHKAILHRPNNNSLVVIYNEKFNVWQIEPWRLVSENEIIDGYILYYTLFNDDPNKLLMVIHSMDIYYFKVYQLLPFLLCEEKEEKKNKKKNKEKIRKEEKKKKKEEEKKKGQQKKEDKKNEKEEEKKKGIKEKNKKGQFVEKLKIGKFCVNTKTKFFYYCDNQNEKVYEFNFIQDFKTEDLYSFSRTIKKMMVSENKNWLFVILVDPVTIVFDLNQKVILKTIEDNNCFRKIILLDSKNILVSMEMETYTIWEVSTLRLMGKFEFAKSKRTLHMQLPTSSLKDIISVKMLGNNSEKFISIHNYSEINNLSFREENFLSNLFLNKYNPHQFMQNFQEMKHIYHSSLTLKKYFNIYLLAVMSDNEKAFETLFEEDKEPFEFNSDQINPLHLLLAKDNNEKLMYVTDFMEKNKVHLLIDRKSFALFLKKQENFIFDYLAKSCTIIKLYENTEDDIVFDHNMTQSITIINHHWPVYTQATNRLLIQSQNTGILVKIKNWFRGLPCQRGIVIYKLNIEWDFSPYTSTSLEFLLAYYHSKSDDFILSPYRHIISKKWKNLTFFFVLQALINWIHIIMYCIFLLNTKALNYFIADVIFLSIILIYEIFCCVANFKHYSQDKWNYVDITNIVLCFLFLFWNHFSEAPVYDMHWVLLILQILSVVLVAIRGFSFFRFIPGFSHITTMSSRMITYSLTIIILIAYCILCLSVVLSIISANNNFEDNDIKNHIYLSDLNIMYNLLFGNIPSNYPQEQDIRVVYIIIIVISSIILPIFFMNLLIAQLSSAYNESEQRHKIISLKEISFLIYEWEVLIRFLKKKIFKQKIDKKIGSIFLVVDKNRLMASEKNSFKQCNCATDR